MPHGYSVLIASHILPRMRLCLSFPDTLAEAVRIKQYTEVKWGSVTLVSLKECLTVRSSRILYHLWLPGPQSCVNQW